MKIMDKQAFYEELTEALCDLLSDERDWIANAANTAALLAMRIEHVNWVGFYFRRGNELVLGPFQGKPACVRIAIGRGVCGTAVQRGQTIIVPDVHRFPGHIACDGASNAEVVVPIVKEGHVVGVLDIDSPILGRFDAADGAGLERIVAVFCQSTDLNS
jgi:L-methionine (R)-S-oxide reductase